MKRRCNQCHKGMLVRLEIKSDYDTKINIYICQNPECPNYALLQIPEEIMEKKRREIYDKQK